MTLNIMDVTAPTLFGVRQTLREEGCESHVRAEVAICFTSQILQKLPERSPRKLSINDTFLYLWTKRVPSPAQDFRP